jgi:nucleoside-diphosphate-sugar epimerase
MRLLIFGLGFCGLAAARLACAAGFQVVGTSRSPQPSTLAGLRIVAFEAAGPEIAACTHILATAAPGTAGDPVLARFGAEIAAAPDLQWIGYLSTTGVYGDRGGAWVNEATPPAPSADRSRRRLAAEEAWRAAASGRSLALFRLAGIYGPGRSAFDDLRAGQARRVVQPGHAFGRIHVADIAGGIMAAIARPAPGTRVLNFSDDEPAESAVVTAEAARLLGVPVPQAVPFAEAVAGMSDMARSFWSENRKVSSVETQKLLQYKWAYPTYREGLRAILQAETLAADVDGMATKRS